MEETSIPIREYLKLVVDPIRADLAEMKRELEKISANTPSPIETNQLKLDIGTHSELLQELDARTRKLEQHATIQRWLFGIAQTIGLAILITLATKFI